MIKIRLSSKIKLLPLVLPAMLSVYAPAQAQPATDNSGPVDIQANEQEFAGDKIIAKGNVRVVYKDSVIRGPAATLKRDAGGNPQTAVFTGHPHLVQGKSLIDAETLMFDIARSRVVADGHAHSEVEQTDGSDETSSTAGSASKSSNAPAGKSGQGEPAQRIITDSDHQEYDRQDDKFEASGHVKVVHGDIIVHALKLRLVYGLDKKPETAIFTGNVVAQQGANNTCADAITYSLTTRRLQASGHVKSKVVQPAKTNKKASSGNSASNENRQEQANNFNQAGAVYAATTGAFAGGSSSSQDDPIIVTSNSQDNSESAGRLSAEGNVRVYYQDMVGVGPKVILIRNSEGNPEKVYFVGRSQISQAGRRWIADSITVTVADKKILAEGNTRALIVKEGASPLQFPGMPSSKMAGRPSPVSIAGKIETPK